MTNRAKSIFAAVASRSRSLVSWAMSQAARPAKRPLTASKAGERTAVSSSSETAEILAARAVLHAEIDRSARRGHVADGLVISLLANHDEELAERQRMLIDDEHRLQASLRRLDAICPPPPPPPAPIAEPSKPQRRRQFHRLDKLLGGDGAGLIN